MIEKNNKHVLGLSMIEMLIGIAVLGLISLAVWSFESNVFSLNNIFSMSFAAQGEARRAFKTMTAEIRSASVSASGAYPIAETSTTSFAFYSDIDHDSIKERVRYFLTDDTLNKGTIEPAGNPPVYNPASEVVSEIVHDLNNGTTAMFEYYDTDYDGTSSALTQPVNVLAVRLIKVTLVIDKNPNRPPSPFIMTTQVSMRNLKDNL